MINYNELDKFYLGTQYFITMNCGGTFLEFGDSNYSLFYKLNDDFYADVNNKGRVAQVLRKGAIITSSYVIDEDSLIPVKNKKDINQNCNFIKRKTFKVSNYKYK